MLRGRATLRKAALHCTVDVSKKADVNAMVERAVTAFGGVDIMVNNAGYTHNNQPMLDVSEMEFDRIYAVNVKALYLAALAVVPVMEKRGGGVIITVASTAGVRPRPGLTWYNGSKGAAIVLTKSMAVELAPKQIRVCAINPVAGSALRCRSCRLISCRPCLLDAHRYRLGGRWRTVRMN
jgi:3-oxoacyl-[acyl-carrier protein] reductase